MDPFDINFSILFWLFADLVTKNDDLALYKKQSFCFLKKHFMRVYVLQMRPPYGFLLILLFSSLFFVFLFSFFCFLGAMRRRAFEFGQAPDQICAQEKISAWAYPHCRLCLYYRCQWIRIQPNWSHATREDVASTQYVFWLPWWIVFYYVIGEGIQAVLLKEHCFQSSYRGLTFK